MKIDRSRQSSGTSGTSKTSKKSASGTEGFQEFIGSASETHSAAGTAAPQSMTSVNSLLAVQSAEDPTERAARNKRTVRATLVLDELEHLHMAVLNNTISMEHMMRLADTVSSHKDKIQDPKLNELLEEIDLRAQVELAKMRKALDKQ